MTGYVVEDTAVTITTSKVCNTHMNNNFNTDTYERKTDRHIVIGAVDKTFTIDYVLAKRYNNIIGHYKFIMKPSNGDIIYVYRYYVVVNNVSTPNNKYNNDTSKVRKQIVIQDGKAYVTFYDGSEVPIRHFVFSLSDIDYCNIDINNVHVLNHFTDLDRGEQGMVKETYELGSTTSTPIPVYYYVTSHGDEKRMKEFNLL